MGVCALYVLYHFVNWGLHDICVAVAGWLAGGDDDLTEKKMWTGKTEKG